MATLLQLNSTTGTANSNFNGTTLDVGGTANVDFGAVKFDAAGTGIVGNDATNGGEVLLANTGFGSATIEFTHVWADGSAAKFLEATFHWIGTTKYWVYFNNNNDGKLTLNNEGTGGPSNVAVSVTATIGTAYTWRIAYDAANGRVIVYQNGAQVYDSGNSVWPRGDAGANTGSQYFYWGAGVAIGPYGMRYQQLGYLNARVA